MATAAPALPNQAVAIADEPKDDVTSTPSAIDGSAVQGGYVTATPEELWREIGKRTPTRQGQPEGGKGTPGTANAGSKLTESDCDKKEEEYQQDLVDSHEHDAVSIPVFHYTHSSGSPVARGDELEIGREDKELRRRTDPSSAEPTFGPGAYRVAPGGVFVRSSPSLDELEGQLGDISDRNNEDLSHTPSQQRDEQPLLTEAELVTQDDDAPVFEAKIVRRKRQMAVLCLALTAVIAIIIGLSVGLTSTRFTTVDAPTGAPTPTPTLSPTSQLDRDFRPVLPPFTIEQLFNTSSPQYRAYEWVTEVDRNATETNSNEMLIRMVRRFALATIFYATGGDRMWNNNASWLDPTMSECLWQGCSCQQDDYTLDSLDLAKNQLVGQLPRETGLLTSLTSMDVSQNLLSGSIPTTLGSLSDLTELDMQANVLTKTIPTELGSLSSLKSLFLTGNGLRGSIPSELAGLLDLRMLELDDNLLQGTIPTEVGRLTRLGMLSLGDNALTGSIPTELGQLEELQKLFLSNNWLAGTLPTHLALLSKLEFLYLGVNFLTGALPSEVGQLTHVVWLVLSENQFTSTVPPEWGPLTLLQRLYLDGNALNGSVPTFLSRLTGLEFLDVHSNAFSGTLSSELVAQMQSLIYFDVSTNRLSGTIPSAIQNMTTLQNVWLYENSFTGSIPTVLGTLTRLSNLALSNNQLNGTIPSELGRLEGLEILSLHDNALTGEVPTELGLLSHLTSLAFYDTNLSGSVPAALCQRVNDQEMYILADCSETSCACECICSENVEV